MPTETMTKERPILFNAEMVRAILAGRKTQTRRVFKFRETNAPPSRPDLFRADEVTQPCPYGTPGDRLWVREAYCQVARQDRIDRSHPARRHNAVALYAADDGMEHRRLGGNWTQRNSDFKWTPSIHMPRLWSRILLEVTDVRVERVQEISEADAVAEGCEPTFFSPGVLNGDARVGGPRREFQSLWDSTTKPGLQWADNPWVWVVGFKVLATEGGSHAH